MNKKGGSAPFFYVHFISNNFMNCKRKLYLIMLFSLISVAVWSQKIAGTLQNKTGVAPGFILFSPLKPYKTKIIAVRSAQAGAM